MKIDSDVVNDVIFVVASTTAILLERPLLLGVFVPFYVVQAIRAKPAIMIFGGHTDVETE